MKEIALTFKFSKSQPDIFFEKLGMLYLNLYKESLRIFNPQKIFDLEELDEFQKILITYKKNIKVGSENPAFLAKKVLDFHNTTNVTSIQESETGYALSFKKSAGNCTTFFSKEYFFNKRFYSLTLDTLWKEITNLTLKYYMGVPTTTKFSIPTNTLNYIVDYTNVVESSTKDIANLLYKYNEMIDNVKVILSTSTKINAQKPKEILGEISINVQKKVRDIIRQKICHRIPDAIRASRQL
ncbi:MAG: hypothetical protein J6Y29_04390 [Clostridiales bacterium]|nr:hypothetical protein [Clostridiales bacterium]